MEPSEIVFARMAAMLPGMAEEIARRFASLSHRVVIRRW